jgi:hypothetical protein
MDGVILTRNLEKIKKNNPKDVIMIITCGKTKIRTTVPVPLDELYVSRLGRGKIALAKLITQTGHENIFVFSGKLGLVPLHFKSPFYDSRNNLPEVSCLERQLSNYKWEGKKLLFLGQKKAFHYLTEHFPSKFQDMERLFEENKGSGHLTSLIYKMISLLRKNNKLEDYH